MGCNSPRGRKELDMTEWLLVSLSTEQQEEEESGHVAQHSG